MLRILLFSLVLFSSLSHGQGQQETEVPEVNQQEQAERPLHPDEITRLLESLITVTDYLSRSEAAENYADDYDRESLSLQEGDFTAQRTMAFWTRVLGFAALPGVIFSAVGLWLLFKNLDLASQTLRQNRAYMTSKEIKLSLVENGEQEGCTRIEWAIENSGESPAVSVRSAFMGRIVNIKEGEPDLNYLDPTSNHPSSLGKNGTTTWVDVLSEFELNSAFENRTICKFVIMAVVEYQDIHGKIYRTKIAKAARFDSPAPPDGESDVFAQPRDYPAFTKWEPFSESHNSEARVGYKEPK